VMMEGNRQAYLQKSNGKLSEEKLMEILDNETWLTAAQCLEHGLCDEVIAEEADLTNANQLVQKMNTTLEQQIDRNKNLAAQLKEFAVEKKEPEQKIEPVIETKQQTNAEKLTAAFNKKPEVI